MDIQISNKELLKDKIHDIHNYLRNNGAGYGMNALKVFNVLRCLEQLEKRNLIDKVGLQRPECEFSYLLSFKNKDEQLAELIFGPVLTSISESKIKDLLFYEIPKNIKSFVFTYLLKQIKEISNIEETCNIQLAGKTYEYFVGRDPSTISELGAYFTDRHITQFIYNKLNIQSVETMIDPFGGSGGFTTGYMMHLNKNNDSIDWSKEFKKINHFDMNDDIVKIAGLELFYLSGGILPETDNLTYKNSFTDEFNDQHYKNVISNPPYGGDKNTKKTKNKTKIEKLKNYILKTDKKDLFKHQLKKLNTQLKIEKDEIAKRNVSINTCSERIQKFAKKFDLDGNDKEVCSLILLMDLLEQGGTCAAVLKEGVFFDGDKNYTNLRKCLIQNYTIEEVISIPQGEFENTDTKTCIVIFKNNGPTKEIKFSDLIVEKFTEDRFEEINGEIHLIENEDDIKEVYQSNPKVVNEFNEIYSLHSKDYNTRELNVKPEFMSVRLDKLCILNPKKKMTLPEYKYVEIGNITKNSIVKFEKIKTNELPSAAKNIATYGNILISCVRPKKEKILLITEKIDHIESYVFTGALANLQPMDSELSVYIYAVIYGLSGNFEKDLCKASSYPRFKSEVLNELNIPFPKSESLLNYYINKLNDSLHDHNLFEKCVDEIFSAAL